MIEEVLEPEGVQIKEEKPWKAEEGQQVISDDQDSVAVPKQEYGRQYYSPASTSGVSLNSDIGLKAKLFSGQSREIQEAGEMDIDVGMSDSELEWRLRELYTTPEKRPPPGLSLAESGLILSILDKPVKLSGLKKLLSTRGVKLVLEDEWQALVGEEASHPPGLVVMSQIQEGLQGIVVTSSGV